jgi:glycosyltransferase involved in cell wall biosynthesis
VLVSPHAGAADDLVRDHDNGRVLPLDVGRWAEAAVTLLRDDAAWQRMSRRCIAQVRDYTYANAAAGIAAAVTHAVRSDTAP